jgi:hypothetical protein
MPETQEHSPADSDHTVFGSSDCRSDYFLTHTTQKHVMADDALEAVGLLRSSLRSRIEVASIERICKVDIK